MGKRRAHHVVRHRWRSYSGPGEGNLAPLAPRTVGIMPKGTAPRSKIISVGSDFAGLGTVYKAVRKVVSKLPRTKARYVLDCEKNPVCMKLAVQADKPDVGYEDFADRDVQTMLGSTCSDSLAHAPAGATSADARLATYVATTIRAADSEPCPWSTCGRTSHGSSYPRTWRAWASNSSRTPIVLCWRSSRWDTACRPGS